MKKDHGDYKTKPFPKMRRLVVDAGWMGHRRHMIHGLVEADVTQARQYIREHKARTGESLSFTAFIVACLGQAVDMDRYIHAYRNWRNQLILFDEVDVLTMIEIEVGDRTFPLRHIIRAANKKIFREIHQEIRAAQAAEPIKAADFKGWYLYLFLPTFIRRSFWRILSKRPHVRKRIAGTVGITSVGMFGQGGGWGIGMPIHTLGITLGGIGEKPGVVDGRIEIREYLSVTISFDHDIIDGAPAARFTQQLKELIESGYGLSD